MWFRRAWFRFVWVVVSAFFNAVCRVETEGQSNIPETGPLIMASNHLHFFDPPLVVAAMPYHEVTVLAAEKWAETWPVSWFLKSIGAIFVHRGEVDREALNKCLAVFEEDGILGLAPEGTRSRSGTMQRAKPGIAYLATKADVPILPLGISGQHQMLAEWKRLRRPRIVVRYGQLLKLEPVQGRQKVRQLQERSDEVMRCIAALVNEDLRGVYTESVRDLESTA
jgi:1-acyl-sn-glycerol-3-phosphate acyltransferase